MKITITIEVEVERIFGKFASKDDIVENLVAEVEGADPGTVDGVGADGDSEYEVVSWEVTGA